MTKKITILCAVFLLLLFSYSRAFASFRLKWVESDAVLDKDDKAQVTYLVRWSCHNASLHGFYFAGKYGAGYCPQHHPAVNISKIDCKKYNSSILEADFWYNSISKDNLSMILVMWEIE
jgi:hypothetical protein